MVADGDDQPLPAGETGEILCRGDVVMAGYWHNAGGQRADDERRLAAHRRCRRLRRRWLSHLKDRSKDVIISGGSNIYPREVEEVLLKHGTCARFR